MILKEGGKRNAPLVRSVIGGENDAESGHCSLQWPLVRVWVRTECWLLKGFNPAVRGSLYVFCHQLKKVCCFMLYWRILASETSDRILVRVKTCYNDSNANINQARRTEYNEAIFGSSHQVSLKYVAVFNSRLTSWSIVFVHGVPLSNMGIEVKVRPCLLLDWAATAKPRESSNNDLQVQC